VVGTEPGQVGTGFQKTKKDDFELKIRIEVFKIIFEKSSVGTEFGTSWDSLVQIADVKIKKARG